jgi:hypothetical protein
MSTARRQLAGCGTQTLGLGFGGNTPPNAQSNATEEYDGSVWAAGGNLATAKRSLGAFGIQTDAIGFGGATGNPTAFIISTTEKYNGTSWTLTSSTPTPVKGSGGAGNTSTGLGFGGFNNSSVNTNATIEYNGEGVFLTKTISAT